MKFYLNESNTGIGIFAYVHISHFGQTIADENSEQSKVLEQ